MASLKYLPVNAPAEDIINEIADQGAVIIEGFLASDTVRQFNEEIAPIMAEKVKNHAHPNEAVEFFHGSQTKHLTGVAGVSDVFCRDILLHPIYKSIGDNLLLPNCAQYILNIAHVLDRGPGADDQLLHRDHDVWPKKMTSSIGGHTQFASMIALSRYTAKTGATRLVPGSHKWPDDRVAEHDDIAVAEMEQGSAAIYLGSTLHGAGSNTSDIVRRGMHTSFCLGWLRTEENSYLSVSTQRVRKMPRRAQELLGFGVHDGIANGEGFLGAVDNANPADLLSSGSI